MGSKILAICILTVLIITAGCADKQALGINAVSDSAANANSVETIDLSKTVSIECSVSMLRFAKEIFEAYGDEGGVTASGKEASIASLANGKCDVAIFCGSVSDISAHEGMSAVVIGTEVIRFIANPASSRDEISMDEIYQLFVGHDDFGDMFDDFFGDDFFEGDFFEDDFFEDDFNGDNDYFEYFEYPAWDITLSEPGTASRVLFEDLFELRGIVGGRTQSLIPEWAIVFPNDGGVIEYVAANENVVGVVGTAADARGCIILSVDGANPEASDYFGKRDVVLAYMDGNSSAKEFAAFLQFENLSSVFNDNGVGR